MVVLGFMRIFVAKKHIYIMNTTITREEALRRWNAAKENRRKIIERMKVMLYEEIKVRTGKEITDFNVW